MKVLHYEVAAPWNPKLIAIYTSEGHMLSVPLSALDTVGREISDGNVAFKSIPPGEIMPKARLLWDSGSIVHRFIAACHRMGIPPIEERLFQQGPQQSGQRIFYNNITWSKAQFTEALQQGMMKEMSGGFEFGGLPADLFDKLPERRH